MYVIETMLPDGPHWYAGIRQKKAHGALIQGPEWSPYWDDRKELNDAQALITFNTVCNQMPGAAILPVANAKMNDSWILIDHDKYKVRAKYMSPGLIVKLPGYSPRFWVLSVDEENFTLRSMAGMSEKHTGTKVFIGKHSEQHVTVVGKKSREVINEEDN